MFELHMHQNMTGDYWRRLTTLEVPELCRGHQKGMHLGSSQARICIGADLPRLMWPFRILCIGPTDWWVQNILRRRPTISLTNIESHKRPGIDGSTQGSPLKQATPSMVICIKEGMQGSIT